MNQLFPNGFLVAIEGIDGAGKTTQIQKLAEKLREWDLEVVASKEPTNSPWGAVIRRAAAGERISIEQEVEAFIEDRKIHVAQVINPALSRGAIVLLDRYFPSNIAYQGARGYDIDELFSKNSFAPIPDLTLILDVDPDTGIGRVRARDGKENSFETNGRLTRAREIFLRHPWPNRRLVDSSRSLEEVTESVIRTVVDVIVKSFHDNPSLTAADQINHTLRLMGQPPVQA